MSILDAAQTDDRRAALVALRDKLASELDATDKQVHAQLAAQLRATLLEIAEIDGLTAAKPKGGVDELKERRDSRSGGRAAANASRNA
jgi:hypothetical protein